MARQVTDPPYIFGIHEPGGEELMLAANRPGWVLFNEYIGHDPEDRTGVDYSMYSAKGLGVICRLNNGREPEGTIPHSSLYREFAQRVANFVERSRGCNKWIIGNEMNYAVERPGIVIDWSRHASVRGGTPQESDPLRHGLPVRFNVMPDYSTEIRTTRAAIVNPGEVITPELYAQCFKLCRDAIRKLPDHGADEVLVGAVAPWNTQTIYGANANGDWVTYFRDILMTLGPAGCDGFALHAYTHGQDPGFIATDEKLPPPFQSHHVHFRTYRDFLSAVPVDMRHLAIYITEADQSEPWLDRNTGWVQAAYAEIDAWNQQAENQRVRALLLYRWPKRDRWHIEGKAGVIEDFQAALRNDYRWKEVDNQAVAPTAASSTTATPGGRRKPSVPDYRVEWIDDRFPNRLTVGQVVSATITVRNAGALTWEWGGERPFRFGYRYFRNRRLLALGPDKDIRTDVPSSVTPGAELTLDVRLALPDQPGNYTLELDLVHEGVSWFKEQGSPVLTRWLTIEPAEDVSADGKRIDSNLPVPLFADVAARLPRSGSPYARRSLDQIRYLIISHTATNPRVRLDHIAQTHIRYGYPGIVYDFVIDPAGQVFKVSELEDVAQPREEWSERGVNICLVGDFSSESPPLPQLDATSRLCAWLAQNLGLTPDTIVGLGEISRGRSPGESFYGGVSWKGILTRQVRLHLAALTGHGDTGRVQELNTALADIRSKQASQTEQVRRLEAERADLIRLNQRLQDELHEMERQAHEQATETIGGVRIHHRVEQLPRERGRYRQRRSQDIRYVVIHHSGTAADASLERIAAAHRVDWPGILYDYYIHADGEISQTQPLDEVVETNEEYLANAVHVAFAGTFDEVIPTGEQLVAGGRLLAWLLERFPQLRFESIRGVSEFVAHASPGAQWLDGQAWKEMLLAAVRQHRGMVEPSNVEKNLRLRIEELEREVEIAQRHSDDLVEQRVRLQAEVQRIQAQFAERQEGAKQYMTPQPAMRTIVDQLPRHPTLRYERRPLGQITHIAIHHTATPPTMGPRRIADLHVSPDASRGKEAWPGIGYHYFIHADGTIDQTNLLETASYHVYKHNMYSVGIVFAGSFMNGKIPTSAQLRSGAHLVAWLMQELNVPLARVWGHREFPDNSTVCPGSEWTLGNRWRDLLFERIEQVQAGVGIKSIRHYMLFWQRAYPGPFARQDFVNAINYIMRFRPALGFSVQDARNAEYVTIVGSEAGISEAEEQTLRESGCKIERIAGRNEEETSRILAEMASTGRRFRTFEADF